MRLYAAVVTEKTDKEETKALRGIDKARDKMTALKKAVADAWTEISALATKEGVTNFQALYLAPEYYFSNQRHATNRFFGQDVKRWIVANLVALAKLYPKMLIIPGTVLWTKDATISRALTALERMQVAEGYGTTVDEVHWSHSSGADVVEALVKPGAKIAQNVAYIALGDKICKYQKVGNFREVEGEAQTLVFAPGSIVGRFSVGGVKYGLEICMDHALGVFNQSVGSDGDVHIRLIVSSTVKAISSKHAAVTIHSSSDQQSHLLVYAPPGERPKYYNLEASEAVKKTIPKSKQQYLKVQSRGLNPLRFAPGGGARLAPPPDEHTPIPLKKDAFTIWSIDLDETKLGITNVTDYTLKDTQLQNVNVHDDLVDTALFPPPPPPPTRPRARVVWQSARPGWLGGTT